MEIRDATSERFVRLEPVRYEFPDLVGVEYDSDWLVIRGRARSDDGEWSFEDPSLLVDEALSFGEWMRSAARGDAPVLEPDGNGHTEPTTTTIEPNLGFGVAGYTRDGLTIRVFLVHESAPPHEPDGRPRFFLDLTTSSAALTQAAADWQAALARFPKRS
ncbi:MAG: hypothetical protein DI534_05185 [Leifsonia xyli]|nr:MAG: hypothetical protein DI534_05185 [Leifsonia xyli]